MTRDSAARKAIVGRMTANGVVAIMRHTEASLAVEAAEALLAGGVDVVEVTLNTAGALDNQGACARPRFQDGHRRRNRSYGRCRRPSG